MLTAEQGQALQDTFDAVLSALDALCLHLQEDLPGLPVWVDNGQGGFGDDREQLSVAIRHFQPTRGFSAKETYACPGAVAATPKTFGLIDCVNAAKDGFRLAVHACKQGEPAVRGDITKKVRRGLAERGYGTLKLKQVYRHLVYVTEHPRRIAWTKGRDGSNSVITAAEAVLCLKKLGEGEHINVQLKQLHSLHPNTKLVIHRPIRPSWVVNLSFEAFLEESGPTGELHEPQQRNKHSNPKGNRRPSAYKSLRTFLPVFYLHQAGRPLPVVCYSAPSHRTVKHRADKRIEDEPFLPSIRAFRYRAEAQRM